MRYLALLLPLIAVLACAQMEPPPGGPPDRTAPLVVEHLPPDGDTGVPLQQEIRVTFSEDMARTSVGDALFISPRPGRDPKLKWRGRRMHILLEDGLQQNMTYVITLGVGCKDLRNNPMASPYSFAFATGENIDRGIITGAVYRDLWPQGGVDLWAYSLSEHQQPDPVADAARYITQTDEGGLFQLEYLSQGPYRVFAIQDVNGDRRFQPQEEMLAMPGGDVVLSAGDDSVALNPFRLTMLDTTGPSLQSAQALNHRQVNLFFDQALDSARAVQSGSYHIARGDDLPDTVRIEAVSLAWSRPETVLLTTSPLSQGAIYEVLVSGLTDAIGNPVRLSSSAAFFEGTVQPDTVGPRLMSTWPADSAVGMWPQNGICLFFDEAVEPDSLEGALVLGDGGAMPLSGQLHRLHGAAFEFLPDLPLAQGRWHTLSLDGMGIQDMAGNRMGDSTVVIHFRTVDEEVPGSISGRVDRGAHRQDAVAIVRAYGPHDHPHMVTEMADETYHLSPLLPGKYLISCILDLDGDGRWDPGRPVPFRPAEPFWVVPDTVTVRSRWETAGVDISY